ncbi:MAG: hypothetical protein KBB83_07615 [Alphaproteobacteria bacterium]|nr:hypothetical protein [Alphaproteobacteria bacterium]
MNSLDYDTLIQEALRDVVRKTLQSVSKKGLPGNHHFYITFRTDRADVTMPDYLRQQHPDEVTVVLQHQFWDLSIEEKLFSVTLSFNGHHERLVIPYGALVSFMDPSVKFGLQFTPDEPGLNAPALSKKTDAADEKSSEEKSKDKSNVVTLSAFRNDKNKK